jgi:hypothetical protein
MEHWCLFAMGHYFVSIMNSFNTLDPYAEPSAGTVAMNPRDMQKDPSFVAECLVVATKQAALL